MKKKISKYGSSSLAFVLSLLLLVSSVIVAFPGSATALTVDESDNVFSEIVESDKTVDTVASDASDVQDVQEPEETTNNDTLKSAAPVKKLLEASGATLAAGTTIYLVDSQSWGSAYVHDFGDTSTTFHQMNKVANTNLYSYTLANASTGCIFLKNARWTNSDETTDDVTFGTDTVFYLRQSTISNGRRNVGSTTFSTMGISDITATKTLYLDNSVLNWSTVKAHYFFKTSTPTSLEIATTWSGVNMTLGSNNTYSITIPDFFTGIIFNNGSAQTVDLTLSGNDGKTFKPNSSAESSGKYDGTWGDGSSGGGGSSTTETTRVYFYNRFNWAHLHCHYWSSTSASTWPGVEMTKDKDHSGLYYVDVPSGTTGLIFNSGTIAGSATEHTDQGFAKTADIAVSSSTANKVFIPQYDNRYTTGEWVSLDDYATTALTTDSKKYFRLYFYGGDDNRLYAEDGKMELYYCANNDADNEAYNYTRTRYANGLGISSSNDGNMTRVYDYTNPSNVRNLYYISVIEGDDLYSLIHNSQEYVRITNGGTFETNRSWTKPVYTVNANENQIYKLEGSTTTESNNSFPTDNNGTHDLVRFQGTWTDLYTFLGYTKPDGVSAKTAVVHAKTGTIRDYYNNGKYAGTYDKYSRLAEVKSIAYSDGTAISTTNDYSYTYIHPDDSTSTEYREKKATVNKSTEFKVTIKIHDEFKNKYYVKAFDVNGVTWDPITQEEALKHKGTGEYTLTYTIDDLDDGPIEITPIYYYFVDNKDSANYITFRVEDFTGEVYDKWGGTIACYAYYDTSNISETYARRDPNAKSSGTYYESLDKPALGGYPGQPMVKEKGSYVMQIPKYLNGSSIMGITLNNYVWDSVHAKEIMHVYNEDAVKRANCQTYDYDDFVALTDVTNTIIFNFKYRTAENVVASSGTSGSDNASAVSGNVPPTTGTANFSYYENGWDALLDYYDKPVDLFCNVITDASHDTEAEVLADAANEIHIISDGYVLDEVNWIGDYGTKWYVYDKNGNFLGCLPPSAFYNATSVDGNGNVVFDEGKFMSYGDANDKSGNTNPVNDGTRTTYLEIAQYLFEQCKGKPAVITYESALYSYGRSGAKQNPGLRNDGRWYYSKPGSKIKGEVVIQIVDADGNIIQCGESDFDSFTTNTHTGSVTGANAYFTNVDDDVNDDSFVINSTQTEINVIQTESDSFRFKADESSTVTEGTGEDAKTYTYVFRGWYLTTGGGLYTSINDGAKLYDVNGSKLMNANAKFVARYEKVEQAVLSAEVVNGETILEPVDRYLVVKHDLLSNSNDATKPTVHNGTGTPYVTVQIYKVVEGTEIVLRTVSNVPGTNAVKIDKSYLSDDYHVRVICSTVTDDETSWYDTYNLEGTTYTKSGKNASNESELGTTSAISDSTNTEKKQIVYEYTVYDLFSGDNNKTVRNLQYLTDLSSNNLKIVFKYYDRAIVNNQPNNISTEPTSITVYGSTKSTQNGTTTYTVANAIFNAFGSTETSKLISNVTDEYKIWTSQTEATEQIALLTNNKIGEKYGSGVTYHTDCYGQPITGSTAADQWVSYTTIGGSGSTVYTGTSEPSLADVNEVTVWCYNSPKTYNIRLNYPKSTEEFSVTDWASNTTNSNSLYFFDKGAEKTEAKSLSGFYNQRLGGVDTDEDAIAAGSNGSVGYLGEYGIDGEKAFEGKNYTPPKKKVSVTTTETVNGEETTFVAATYQFKGWYIQDASGAYSMISGDIYYQNRITKDLTLYAAYEPENTAATTKPGVTVTNNGKDEEIDYYVKNNEFVDSDVEGAEKVTVDISGVDYYVDEAGIKRVRFNTGLPDKSKLRLENNEK